MVKGYKYINIKDEVVDRIRNSKENKKEVEEGTFNLAGFVTKVLLGHLNNTDSEPPKTEGLTTEQVKRLLSGELQAFFDKKNIGDVIPATSSNEEGVIGLSNKDIKRIAAEMLLEIGMHIENGVAKGVKELR